MADFISGIKNVPPTYPIRPVQPGSKDRKSDKRKKDQPRPDEPHDQRDDDDRSGDHGVDDSDRPPAIDEYV